MSEASYQIRSSREGTIVSAARSEVGANRGDTELGFTLGERFADRLPDEYRIAYDASWDDLFAVVGAARNFDTVVEARSGFWSVHLHETSVLVGDEVVVESAIDRLRAYAPVDPVTDEEDTDRKDTDRKDTDGKDTDRKDTAGGDAGTDVAARSGAPGTRRVPTLAELAALIVLVAVAALFRFVDVAHIPTGLHGDEAITGIEAWRVQAEGNIGIYTGSGLGQPTLMYYPLALVQRLFGDGVATIRGFAAFGGLVSVVLVWWGARRRIGAASALGAAAALAIMVWSVHYSRIAFNLAWWPAFALLGAYSVDRAIEKNTGWRWALSGFIVGIGIYVYSAHWVFGAAVALFLVGWMVLNHTTMRTYGRGIVIFVASGLVTIAPMVRLMLRGDYGGHIATIGIQATPAWQNASFGAKIGLVADGYRFAWSQLLAPTMIDYSDGAGIVTPIGAPLLTMAIVGAAFGAWRYRSRTVVLALVIVALVPMASAVTAAGHGPFRRDFAIAPFIALFVGLFIGELWEGISPRLTPLASFMVAIIPLLLVAALSRQAYFETFGSNETQKWIFAGELIGPATVMDEYGDRAFVNFYSWRHPFAYESIRYLAPDARGVDRSAEFGRDTGFGLWKEAGEPQLYMLIGPYTTRLDELRDSIDGTVVASGQSAGVPFVAYLTSS